ncbi:MAG: hypothetical protein SPL96_04325 [Bacteroidales bacterium]|nr:hypothetical protein [Bacteroidales bacterium]
MEEKKMTERESLELITTMIKRTRERYIGDGNIMLMWGYLSVVVAALVWIMLVKTHNPVWNWLWFAIGVVGGIATPIMSKKSELKSGAKSYSDKITSQIWTVVGISAFVATLFCFVFSFMGMHNVWRMMFAFALIIVPMAEMAQGIVVKEKSFIFGGAVGLCIGIFAVCCIAADMPLGANWFLPMYMIAFACMMIIPGHIINRKARQQR